jgi:hypothetical protein
MADIHERREVRVDSGEHSFVFVADSADGRLVIRQEERSGRTPREVCALTLADPEELRAFFEGLRRVLGATGHAVPAPAGAEDPTAELPASGSMRGSRRVPPAQRASAGSTAARADDPAEREAMIAEARQRNPNTFQPWTSDEERRVRERFENGEAIPAIARAHRRSPKAIEMRLKRLGVLKDQ